MFQVKDWRRSMCGNMENLFVTFSGNFENKIKAAATTVQQFLDPSLCTDQEFYVKSSCCLLLAGNRLESYGTWCMCVSVRSSVNPNKILCLLRTDLCWLAIMRLGEKNEWDPNRHSALWSISIARVCCHYTVYLIHIWTRDDFLLGWTGFTAKQTVVEKARAGQSPAWSVFVSLQCLSVSDRLCLYAVPVGLRDPNAPTPTPSSLPVLAGS